MTKTITNIYSTGCYDDLTLTICYSDGTCDYNVPLGYSSEIIKHYANSKINKPSSYTIETNSVTINYSNGDFVRVPLYDKRGNKTIEYNFSEPFENDYFSNTETNEFTCTKCKETKYKDNLALNYIVTKENLERVICKICYAEMLDKLLDLNINAKTEALLYAKR